MKKDIEIKSSIAIAEKIMIEKAIEGFGTKRETGKTLSISQPTIVGKIKRYGIRISIHK